MFLECSIYIFIRKDKDIFSMSSKGERRCKYIVERMLKRSFHKARPDFLKNPKTNRNLELDLYNDTLKISIEFNGIQHYEYTERFHKTYKDFRRQLERDTLKKQLCRANNVFLICIPFNCSDIHRRISARLRVRDRLLLQPSS